MSPTCQELDDQHRTEVRAGLAPQFLTIAPRQYVAIDGIGAPLCSDAWSRATSAVLSVAFAVRHLSEPSREEPGPAGLATPLLEAMSTRPTRTGPTGRPLPSASRSWTLMVAQPQRVRPELLEHAQDLVSARSRSEDACGVRLIDLDERRCAQVLHVGSLGPKETSVEVLHRFIGHHNASLRGCRHEIFLSDPQRTDPAALRTVIRHPISAGVRR